MGLFKSKEEKYQLGLKAYEAGDYYKALEWLGKADTPDANYLMGVIREKKNDSFFASHYKWAGEAGHAEAQFRYGQLCLSMHEAVTITDQNDRTGLHWCQLAAKQGHAGAQYLCGQCFEKGRGTQADRAVALQYYLLAADQGHKEAQYACGRLCASTSVDGAREEALRWYEKAAVQGQAEAQLACAMMYESGEGAKKDTAKAYNWAKKAMENGVKGAEELCRKLGKEEAKKVLPAAIEAYEAKDYKKALPLMEQAATLGIDSAQYFCGFMYQNGLGTAADAEKAFFWYEKAAEQGNEKGQLHCGSMYDKGEGIAADKKKALFWYEKAAGQGNEVAALACAMAYYRGVDIPRNTEKALAFAETAKEKNETAKELFALIQKENEAFLKGKKAFDEGDYQTAFPLFEQAANDGNEDAIYYCALLYESGQGTEMDLVKALHLYEEAGERGQIDAQFCAGNMRRKYYKGDSPKEAEQQTLRWFLMAAKQGHADAQFYCGDYYLNGKGTAVDEKEALFWFEKAAEQGMKAAQYNTGLMYENGMGTEEDKSKAFFWYEKAAEQGFVRAQNKCGYMYYIGKGVKKDGSMSFYWYQKSAEQGDVEGQRECGIKYYYGWGVEKDRKKAKGWLEKAAAQGDKIAKNSLRDDVF